MKTLFFSLALSATVLMANPSIVRAQSGEEMAVRKVIDDSRVAFEKRDLTAFGNCFVKSADLYYEVAPGQPDVDLIIAHGHENMLRMVGGYFRAVPKSATPPTLVITDYRVRVNGNSAFANADGVETTPDGKKNYSRDFMVLEKQNGTWKIASLLVITTARAGCRR